MQTILTVAITFITTSILTWCLNTIKGYKKRDNTQEEALKCLLRSSITSKYYVYSEIGSIPQYEKENLNYMYEQYKKMNGNSYINQIMEEINKLLIKK